MQICEGWVVCLNEEDESKADLLSGKTRPSEHPDKSEAIVMTYKNELGDGFMLQIPFTKKDEDFRCISQKVINSYFDIPIKDANGKDVSDFYIKKRYDLIEKYVTEEFTFEMLYQSLLDYLLLPIKVVLL